MMLTKKIPIFMYHSIESMPKSTIMRSLHVPPRRFKFQMWILNLFGYKGLSIRELRPYLTGEKKGKVVGITFDDGYQNVLTNAAPILKKYNFTSTCYIVSNCIGSSNIWDSPNKITQRPLMSEMEVGSWIGLGMDIGAHTKNHIDLTSISKEEAKKEIGDCKIELERKYKVKVNDFCYPFGRFNKTISEITRDLGYLSATTMKRGKVNLESDIYTLPRIPINYRTLPHLFLIKLLTNYEDNRKP